MLPASSTVVPPTAQPSSNQKASRSSNSIQKGADLLLELFNEEQSHLTLVCRENEKRFNNLKTQAEAQIASSHYQLAQKTALYENLLSTQHVRFVRDLEAAQNELKRVRGEYEKLMASIRDVGLVYMDRTLHFDVPTAKIVSDFQENAQILDMVISELNPNFDTRPIPCDSNKPSDFFFFLSSVIDNQHPHVLRMMQSKNAAFSEGNVMPMKDTTLDDSGSEPDVFLVWPGTSSTDSRSLSVPENEGVLEAKTEVKSPTLKRSSPPAPGFCPSNKLHKPS